MSRRDIFEWHKMFQMAVRKWRITQGAGGFQQAGLMSSSRRYVWWCVSIVSRLFRLVWFICFNGISTLFRLFNAKAIFLEEQRWYYLTHSWEDKGIHTFPKGICPKVNVIARLEYELANYDSAVHRFNHYTTRTPPVDYLNDHKSAGY